MVLLNTFKIFQILYLPPVGLTYLVQQECAMTRHSPSVVHHCRDIAREAQMKTSLTGFIAQERFPWSYVFNNYQFYVFNIKLHEMLWNAKLFQESAEWKRTSALDAFGRVRQDTHSPLASSSQISKNTMRSYLQWQGPACGRVMVVSLVAGTVLKKEMGRL